MLFYFSIKQDFLNGPLKLGEAIAKERWAQLSQRYSCQSAFGVELTYMQEASHTPSVIYSLVHYVQYSRQILQTVSMK